jgi:hypothetical protein
MVDAGFENPDGGVVFSNKLFSNVKVRRDSG